MRADEIIVMFSDGRKPLRRRDLTVDNFETMRRERYDVDRSYVTSWTTAAAVEQMRAAGRAVEPWGTYRQPLQASGDRNA